MEVLQELVATIVGLLALVKAAREFVDWWRSRRK